MEADMMIGDLIQRFDNEAVAAETLASLEDVALLADIATAAAEQNLTLGEFATMSIDRFVTGANDEDWLRMFTHVTRASDPGAAFLHHILSDAVKRSVPPEDAPARSVRRQ
jgi:hypothetical protein